MLKKIVKYLFLGIIALVAISFLSYYSFIGVEYFTGDKFVDYLQKNAETIKLEDSFTFKNMESDLEKNQLVLVGEIHGIEESSNFDFDLFKHLYTNHGIRHYLAELDFTQATYMNQYMENGDDSLLHFILKNWVVVQGRNNKTYYEKYKKFQAFHSTLPEDQKFSFIGIDRIQDWRILTRYVNELTQKHTFLYELPYAPKTIKKDLIYRLEELKQIAASDSLSKLNKFEIEHLLLNLNYVQQKVGREQTMFNNLKILLKEYELENKKLYGFFGGFHAFQFRVNGQHPLASLIRQSDLPFNNKTISVNFLYVDSYMVLNSKMLPKQVRTGKTNSRIPLSSDNIIFMYIYGIQDFKRMTPEKYKSLIKLNGENNPYRETARLTSTYQILPIIPTFEMTDKGKPYVQYTVFVRNSDWAEPYVK